MADFAEAVAADRRTRLTASRDLLASLIESGSIPPYKVNETIKEMNRIADELDGVIAQEDGDEIGQAAATPDEPWPADWS